MKRNILSALVYGLFLFGVGEAGLRFQQHFGPLFNFEFPDFAADVLLSETLNHKPTAQEFYNPDGIQSHRPLPPDIKNSKAFRVLFLGDSFMQGYPPSFTIPEFIRDEFISRDRMKDEAFIFLNAGYSSYAPSIYTVQAKALVPKYRPDLIVVDIDESDLVDDFAIYKHLAERDADGKIMAVRGSPPLKIKAEGFEAIRRQPFYLTRLFSMWLHKVRFYFIFEAYKQKYKSKYLKVPLAEMNRRFSFNLAPGFDPASDADRKYGPETDYFKFTARELIETLVKLMGDPQKVLVLYHPHLHQWMPDPQGRIWRRYVPAILNELSLRYGVEFYDASEDLKSAFGQEPAAFYHERDMHFNPQGMQIYSRFIAGKIRPRLTADSMKGAVPGKGH